jgi:hypothetical protein
MLLVYLVSVASHDFFWDLSVYERALRDLRQGLDPYRGDAGLPFVYHPLVLDALAWLNRLVSLRFALVVLYLLSFGWFCREVLLWLRTNAQWMPPQAMHASGSAGVWRGVSSLLAAAVFGGVGVTAVLSGNLTTFMHLTLIAAFLMGQRKGGRLASYALVALVLVLALIKPYFLLYLLIPPLLADGKRVEWVRAAAGLALFAMIWLLLAHADPQRYAAFMAALNEEALGKSDYGYSFFATFMRIVHNHWLALALHVIASALLLGLAMLLFVRKARVQRASGAAFFLLYMVLTLANPRMKEYDFFPALVCFFIFLQTIPVRAGLIVLTGLCISWIPLLIGAMRAAGVAFPALSGASNTWQIVGLAAATLTLALTLLKPRVP